MPSKKLLDRLSSVYYIYIEFSPTQDAIVQVCPVDKLGLPVWSKAVSYTAETIDDALEQAYKDKFS